MAIKTRVSSRDFIAKDGKVVDRIEEASGARYTLLKPDGQDDKGKAKYATFKAFDYQLGEPGNPETMCAVFGFHTKVGNVVNTILNDAENPGTPESAATGIEEWIAELDKGIWAERTGGAGGLRYDPEVLANAIASVTGKDAASFAAKMSWKVDPKTGAQVAADTKGALSYGAFAMRNAKVKAAYDAAAGTGTAVESL